MRIIDIMAIISYSLIIINSIVLVWYVSSSVIFQVKNGVVAWIVCFVFCAGVCFTAMQGLLTASRYLNVSGTSSNNIRDWYGGISLIFAIFFSGINYLLVTKNTDRVFRIFKKKGDK